MTDSERIFQAIRGLPVRERLRIVERVVHDIADAPGAEPVVSSAVEASSLLGLFANEPELMDEVCRTAMEDRRRDPLRIASIAIHLGSTLVTGNASDYNHIQAIGYPLRMENWRTA